MKWDLRFEKNLSSWYILPFINIFRDTGNIIFSVGWLCFSIVLDGWDSNWIPF
jgi:hypothetical protein